MNKKIIVGCFIGACIFTFFFAIPYLQFYAGIEKCEDLGFTNMVAHERCYTTIGYDKLSGQNKRCYMPLEVNRTAQEWCEGVQ